ncbi:hypothetical protein KEM55_005660, partial [Ascosphaera atra]
ILTATSAGGAAGVLTCPCDVVKTRIQTQVNPEAAGEGAPAGHGHAQTHPTIASEPTRPSASPSGSTFSRAATSAASQMRTIYTNPTPPKTPGAPILDTSSVLTGLKILYQTEGILGWFRGVGPRFVWTSVQSGTMLVLYQVLLKKLGALQNVWDAGGGVI